MGYLLALFLFWAIVFFVVRLINETKYRSQTSATCNTEDLSTPLAASGDSDILLDDNLGPAMEWYIISGAGVEFATLIFTTLEEAEEAWLWHIEECEDCKHLTVDFEHVTGTQYEPGKWLFEGYLVGRHLGIGDRN